MSDHEDDGEALSENLVFKPSYVLLAIDADSRMFVKDEDSQTSPFNDCLSACYEVANSLIFTQSRRTWSPFGIVFALEDGKASFVNFNDNLLDSIKTLKAEKEKSEDELRNKYQRKGSLDLAAFFLFCKKKFKEVDSVFYKRTIMFITNDDDPVRGDPKLRFAALNEAKNFEASGITFDLVTMNPKFDYSHFYNELFSVMKTPPIETIVEDQDGLLEKISSAIVMKVYKRKLPFYPVLGNKNKYLLVVQKKVIREEKLYQNAHINKDGKVVKKVPQASSEEDSNVFIVDGRKSIEFSLEEYCDLYKTELEIGYTLLYVSDRNTDVGCVLKDVLLLESDPKEELPFFGTLWQYCVNKKKVLVCARRLRQKDKIRFVELIPKFANNAKFFIIQVIPFADEIEPPQSSLYVKEEDVVPAEVKTKVMEQLIDKLSFDYHPKMFTNPETAKLKAFLRSKLLDEPKEDVEDVTLDNEGIDSRLGQLVDKFEELFPSEEEKGTKRRGTAVAGKSKKKK